MYILFVFLDKSDDYFLTGREKQIKQICIFLQLPFLSGKSLLRGGSLIAFQRKSSKVLAEALERAGNLRAIDPNLDLGNGLTLAAYDAKIDEVQTALDTYNGFLAQADAAGNDFRADEKDVRNMSSMMLSGVKVKFGRDSNEYEMAGGTRLSDRKRRFAEK